MSRDRAENEARREEWVKSLGLVRRNILHIRDHSVIDRIIFYDWLKGEGRQFDRTILMVVYEDGTFMTHLDDGTIRYDQSKINLQLMAVATNAEAVHEQKPMLTTPELATLVGLAKGVVSIADMDEAERLALVDKLHRMEP